MILNEAKIYYVYDTETKKTTKEKVELNKAEKAVHNKRTKNHLEKYFNEFATAFKEEFGEDIEPHIYHNMLSFNYEGCGLCFNFNGKYVDDTHSNFKKIFSKEIYFTTKWLKEHSFNPDKPKDKQPYFMY